MKDFILSIIKFYNGNKTVQVISVIVPILIFSYIIYAYAISNPTDAKYLVDDKKTISKTQIKEKNENEKKQVNSQTKSKSKEKTKEETKEEKIREKNHKDIRELRKKRFDSELQKNFDFENNF